MAIKSSFKYTLGAVSPPQPGETTVSAKFRVSNITSPTFTPTKQRYNKSISWMQGYDDALINHYEHVYKVYNGGYSSVSNKTYPGYKYSDGTGKMIAIRGTLVLPSGPIRAANDTNTNSSTLRWDQINEMVAAGWGINNHSWKHGDRTPSNRYHDRLNDFIQSHKLFYEKANYRTLVMTPPASEPGFEFTARNLGYFAANSNYNEEGTLETIYGTADFEHTPNHFFNLDRAYNGDNFTSDDIVGMKQLIDQAWDDHLAGKQTYHNAFTHGPGEWQNFDIVIDYLMNNPRVPNSSEKIWFPSIQEWFEYRHTRQTSRITYELEGDILTINIDQSDIMPNVRDRGMTLLTSGFNITELVEFNGPQEVTFNPSTGLVNIYNIDTTHYIDPANDPLPARILSMKANGNIVKITYDRAVTQTLKAAYTKDGTNATQAQSLTGSGTIWYVTFDENMLNKTPWFRSNLGDCYTVDNGMRVTDYVEWPITETYSNDDPTFSETLTTYENMAGSVYYASSSKKWDPSLVVLDSNGNYITKGTTNTNTVDNNSVATILDKKGNYNLNYVGKATPVVIERPPIVTKTGTDIPFITFENVPYTSYATDDFYENGERKYYYYPHAMTFVLESLPGQSSEAWVSDYGSRNYIGELNGQLRVLNSPEYSVPGSTLPSFFKRDVLHVEYARDFISVWINGTYRGQVANNIPEHTGNFGDLGKLRNALGVTTNSANFNWYAMYIWYTDQYSTLNNNRAAILSDIGSKFNAGRSMPTPYANNINTVFNSSTRSWSATFDIVNGISGTTRYKWFLRDTSTTGQDGGNFTPQYYITNTPTLNESEYSQFATTGISVCPYIAPAGALQYFKGPSKAIHDVPPP
jgi:hypothetical protein